MKNTFNRNDSLIVNFDLKLKKLRDTSYYLANDNCLFYTQIVEKGLKKRIKGNNATQNTLNLKALLSGKILSYMHELVQIEQLTSQKSDNNNKWNEIRICDASFQLPPNVTVTCKLSAPVDSISLRFSDEISKKISPVYLSDKEIKFSFFISKPAPCALFLKNSGTLLQLTPNDFLIVDIDTKNSPETFSFKGKGSAGCQYVYELNHNEWVDYYGNYLDDYMYKNKKHIVSVIEERHDKFLNLYNRHKGKMAEYWQYSNLIDLDYWLIKEWYWAFAGTAFADDHSGFTEHDLESFIDTSKNVKNICPILDYLYTSTQYHEFLSRHQYYMTRSNNSYTTSGNQNEYSPEQKLMVNQMTFKGYPEYFTSARLILNFLIEKPLKEVQKVYDNFIKNCNDTKMKSYLQFIYKNKKKIQPGQSIKNLDLSIAPYLDLKEKADGYILLDLSYSKSNYMVDQILINHHDSIFKAVGVQNKAQILVVRDEVEKAGWTNKSEKYNSKVSVNFHPKGLIHKDCQVLNVHKYRYVLLRNDGTIIHTNITRYGDGDSSSLYDVLHEDINKPVSLNQADNSRLGFAILLSLLFSGVAAWGIVKIRTHQIRKKEVAKRQLAELELRAIRSQMNPHFLFNALSSIQYLINKNQIKAANIYLSQFADMMRLVLNNSEKPLVSLADELKLIENYLELEKLRVPFEYNITIDPNLNTEEEELPGMLIQPFVENAVVHGITPQRKGQIDIRFIKNEHYINCQIIDDGVGISQGSTHRKGNGKAVKMVQERINIVNSQSNYPFSVQLIDRKEKGETSGTIVKIKIPI